MSQWLWQSGHLAWPLFFVIVYSGLLLIAGDLFWRLVTRPAWQLAIVVVLSWVLGVAVILLLAGK